MKIRSVALAVTVPALLIAGCGGSDKKADTTSTRGYGAPRGYTETGQALDAICAKVEAQAKPLSSQATGDPKHDAPLIAKLVAVNDKYIPQVKAVTPDPKLKRAYDQFVTSLEQIATVDKTALDAAKKGDNAAYVAAIKSQNALNKPNKQAARALGAPACAKN